MRVKKKLQIHSETSVNFYQMKVRTTIIAPTTTEKSAVTKQ